MFLQTSDSTMAAMTATTPTTTPMIMALPREFSEKENFAVDAAFKNKVRFMSLLTLNVLLLSFS